jgi:hypothetical protein
MLDKAAGGVTKAAKAGYNVLVDNPIARMVRGIASCLVGLPVAVAATAVLITSWAVMSVIKHTQAEVIRYYGGGKEVKYNPTLQSIGDFLWESTSKVWTEFGIYGYVEAAKLLREQAEHIQNDMGGGSAADVDSGENLMFKAGDKNKIEEAIRQADRNAVEEVLEENSLIDHDAPSQPTVLEVQRLEEMAQRMREELDKYFAQQDAQATIMREELDKYFAQQDAQATIGEREQKIREALELGLAQVEKEAKERRALLPASSCRAEVAAGLSNPNGRSIVV